MSKQKPEKPTDAANPHLTCGLRRPYESPRLTAYGDLRQLTQGGTANNKENTGANGNPHTHI